MISKNKLGHLLAVANMTNQTVCHAVDFNFAFFTDDMRKFAWSEFVIDVNLRSQAFDVMVHS